MEFGGCHVQCGGRYRSVVGAIVSPHRDQHLVHFLILVPDVADYAEVSYFSIFGDFIPVNKKGCVS